MLTEEEKDKILELKGQGYSDFKIGKMLGVDPKTVAKHSRGNNSGGGEGPSLSIKNRHPELRGGQHTFIPKKSVIPVTNPSQKVVNQREDVEVTELEVRKEKAVVELGKIKGPQVSSRLQEARDQVEITKLSVEQYEAKKKLKGFVEEEERKARAEEEDRFEREIERQMLAEEQERTKQHLKWIEGWKEWSLTWGVPRGVSIPADVKFKIKDGVGKVLMDRSEQESKWDIEELVKITTQSVLQPFLDKVKAEKKTQLIQLYALPKIEDYIRAQGLTAYVDEETKGKVKEHVRDRFIKTLTGNESFILSHEVTNLLDTFFKPVKEKIKQAQEEERREKQEREKREREKREAEEKAFWEKVREKREKEEIEELLQTGMGQFNLYLLRNRKELGIVNTQEQERAKRHLERELKEQIEGTETDEEVEKIADETLDSFFFE